ncbi:MAG: zinc metallopeptidase [Verrucomicrobia bacterium]|nr:MAG: zinc metallopeptidase [Verrucomicrobiota bacterium]
MFWNPAQLLFALPGLLLGLYAQFKLMATYKKYIRVPTLSGLSGAEAAREILDRAGLTDVPVEMVAGHLTDHYDPTKRALFLSEEIFASRTVAAVGVAAHEAGHALQHQAAYAPLQWRMTLVPVTQFASAAYLPIFLLGMVLKIALPKLIFLIIAIFAVITLFQLVTLPVEFDASRRAKEQLFRLGLVREEEAKGVNKVLGAAALTYVAAMVTSMLELLYWLTLARNNRN